MPKRTSLRKRKEAVLKGASFFIRDLPIHVKNHFKSTCAKKGLAMKDVLVTFMRNYIRENN